MTAHPARAALPEPPPKSPKRPRSVKVRAARPPNIVLWDEADHDLAERHPDESRSHRNT